MYAWRRSWNWMAWWICNWALLSVYTERRRIASNKLPRGIALVKQHTIPRDDLGDLDGDEELFLEDCVYEQQSTPV